MRVKCLTNVVPEYYVKQVEYFTLGSEYSRVEIGKEYFVLAAFTFKKCADPHYIVDISDRASILPHILFELVCGSLPENWHCSTREKKEEFPFEFVCGFPELSESVSFYADFIDGASYTKDIYYNRKKELTIFHRKKIYMHQTSRFGKQQRLATIYGLFVVAVLRHGSVFQKRLWLFVLSVIQLFIIPDTYQTLKMIVKAIMKALCKRQSAKINFDTLFPFLHVKSPSLILNKEYIIAGLIEIKNEPFIHYIVDVDDKCFLYPSICFELISFTLPECWKLKIYKKDKNDIFEFIYGFPELITRDEFIFELLEMNPLALTIYKKRKKQLILHEKKKLLLHFDSAISLSAKCLNDIWVLCENCHHSWKCIDQTPMLLCPQCETILHNPRHIQKAL